MSLNNCAFFETPIEVDGVDFVGPWRTPHQMLADQTFGGRGSIHDDATAQGFGFKGGTIEGPTHFTQFEPLCARAWGRRWFESGCISAHFKTPVFEGESTQARIRVDGEAAELSLLKADGSEVLSGAACVDSRARPTALDVRLASLPGVVDARILQKVRVGDRVPRRAVKLAEDGVISSSYPFTLSRKIAALTEPSVVFEGASADWPGPILPLELISVLFCHDDVTVAGIPDSAVGLFADQEIRLLQGPLYAGQAYEIEGEVVAISESRRTEGLWIRSQAFLPGAVEPSAEMLLNCAFLKGSSGA